MSVEAPVRPDHASTLEFVATPVRRRSRPRGVDRSLVEALIFAGFYVLAIVATWPMVAHLGDRVRDIGDPVFTGWALPWDVHALLRHPWSIFQANIFYPEPNTLAYADHMIGLVPIAAPFWLLTHDPIVTNNGTVISLIALAGIGAYLLAFEVCHRRWPAIVAGVIFALAPYHFMHIGHTNLLASYPMPLTWLFALRVVRRRRVVDAGGLAVFWVLTMMSSWYYFIFVSLTLLPIVAVELFVRRREMPWKRITASLAAVGVVVGAVAVLLAVPYFRVRQTYPEAKRPLSEAETYTPGPSDFLLTSPDSRLYGELTEPLRREGGEVEKVLFSGWFPVLLALAGVGRGIRARAPQLFVPYLAVIAGMLAIAFGPYQDFWGARHRMPFYFFYTYVPGMQFMRSMARAQVLVTLSVAVLAAVGLSGLRRRPDRALVSIAAAIICAAELAAAPVALEEAPRAGRVYGWLASAPQEGPVLVLPTAEIENGRIVESSKIREAKYMAFSTQHWRPILNGYSGFAPPSYRTMVMRMQSFPDASSLRFLRNLGVAYVVVERSLVIGTPWDRLALAPQVAGLEIAYEDIGTVAYRVLGATTGS